MLEETRQPSLPGLDSPMRGEVKNEPHTMLHSFFALKPGRTDPIVYRSDKVEIIVKGTNDGCATVNDKELLIYACSIIDQKLKRGEATSPVITFTARDYMRVTGKSCGGRNYELLEEAIGRLQGTQIKTNIETGGEGTDEWFSWVESAKVNYRRNAKGEKVMTRIQMKICDWLYRAVVIDRKALTNDNKLYFKLSSTERRLYEVAHALLSEGTPTESVALTVPNLRLRVAAISDNRRFLYDLRRIAEKDSLPDYYFEIRSPGDDAASGSGKPKRTRLDKVMVVFYRRPKAHYRLLAGSAADGEGSYSGREAMSIG